MSTTSMYTLFHSTGCGSTFPLVLLRLFGVAHEVVELDYQSATNRVDTPQLKRLLAANPLAQFPTLVTPDGAVMTETVAIALYLCDRHASHSPWDLKGLTPSQLAAFYRWMVFFPANVYPTITIVEFPERYIAVPADAPVSADVARKWVENGTGERRKDAWKLLEEHLGKAVDRSKGKFALGTETPTVLDIYLALMAHWTPHPRYDWFSESCPILMSVIKETLKAVDVVRQTFEENELDGFTKVAHAKKLDGIP